MPPASGTSPQSSSDLYLDSDADGGIRDPEGRQVESGREGDTSMEISGSDTSSPGRFPANASGPLKPEQKRKRKAGDPTLLPSNSQGESSMGVNSGVRDIEPEPKRRKPTSKAALPSYRRTHQGQTQKCQQLRDSLYHGLTVPIWQKVFGFVPPVFLGRVLMVSRLFHFLLEYEVKPLLLNVERRLCDADQIWKASRKRFAPGLPRNLVGQNDLELWRLLRGNGCQICGQKYPLETASNFQDPWRPCPTTENSVRVIWSFGVRCCRNCLKTITEQEIDLLVSSTFPSFLLPALPFAFITQSEHYIFSSTVKKADCPPNVRIIKHYYKPHIEDLKSRFASARELGKGSAEEWVKGLEVEGGERTSRILTWEQWEGKGGLKKVNARPSGKLSTMRTSAGNKSTMQLASSSLQQSVAGESVLHGFAGSFAGTAASPAPQSVAPTFKPTNQVSHGNGMLPQRPGSQAVPPRQERTLRDVNEAKAVRRAEIERRCAALQPPLTSNLLRHMNSFQAALQISLPLTEKAWEVLAPRLLSQREMAENAEREWAQQVKAIEAEAKESRRSEASQLEPKESIEHEWELSHTPLWDRLSGYADEIIQGQWAAGQAVTKENCSRFAVDVLLHVRKRFYDDLATDKTGTYGTRKQIEDRESHEKSDEKLILEHMKWVFDNKIKAFTEHFQRELFMCSGCEGSSKFYGFEAVIQHYAAKHTTSLSQGSVVVHWRAEWPDPPPFVLNPSLANSVFYAVPTPAVSASPPRPSISQAPQPGHGNTTAAFTVASPVAVPYNGFGSNYLGSYYPQYAAHYPSQQQPGSATGQSHYPHLFGHLSPITNGSYVYQGPQSGYVAQTFPPDRPPIYPMGHQPHAESHASSYGYSPHMPLVALPGAHLYQTQREEMAKQARDVWFATSGIKDLPQSVRIHVVIQHVVSRFEQKYTNEPSLSMFLDGLDSSSLMRPVRSLNGLACKTCVATANATHPTSSPLAPQSLTDRKLYTLPHLLNHFRSAHLERVQPTIDLQTGMKAARLDWTKDMIELPEAHLIARLTTASGMTDTKLRLIATVLPGVFPDPLPDICADKASGPVPKYGPVQPHKSQHQSPRQPGIRHIAGSQEFGGSASHESSLSPAGAHLPSQRRTEALESEPPGDDEYDPHRPAFLGRIVEHHHISHPLSRSGEDASGQRQYCSDSIGSATHTTNSEALRHSTSFSRDNGPYGIQLLRHQDKSHQQVLQVRSTYTAVNQNTEPIHKLQKESRFDVEPEVMAADRFLNELKPEIGDLDNRGLSSNLQATSRCMSQAFSELAETEDTESTREQRYVPSNIYSRAPAITSSDTYMYQRQARPEEFRYSTRRVQYVYTDDGRPIENFSQAGTITSKYSLPSRGADGSTYAYIDHIRLSNDNLQPERGLIPSRITTPPAEASNSLGYGRDSLNSPRHKINHAEHLAHASLDNIQSYSHEPRYYESSGTDPRARHTEYIPVSPNDYQYMVRYEPNQEAAGRYPYRSEDNLAQGSIVRDRRVRYSEDLLSGSRYQPNSSANHQTHHVYR